MRHAGLAALPAWRAGDRGKNRQFRAFAERQARPACRLRRFRAGGVHHHSSLAAGVPGRAVLLPVAGGGARVSAAAADRCRQGIEGGSGDHLDVTAGSDSRLIDQVVPYPERGELPEQCRRVGGGPAAVEAAFAAEPAGNGDGAAHAVAGAVAPGLRRRLISVPGPVQGPGQRAIRGVARTACRPRPGRAAAGSALRSVAGQGQGAALEDLGETPGGSGQAGLVPSPYVPSHVG